MNNLTGIHNVGIVVERSDFVPLSTCGKSVFVVGFDFNRRLLCAET